MGVLVGVGVGVSVTAVVSAGLGKFCGRVVHVGAVVREGTGEIVVVGVQVACKGMMVLVGVIV